MNELSPLRYPGGKSRVAPFIAAIFEHNDLTDGHYIEPYAGGAGVALSLLMSEVALVAHINDLDPAIHAMWSATLNETEQFCQRIRDVPVNVEQWKKQRAVQFAESPDPMDLAVSTFYLNRANRSGIIRGGGVIGGLEQKGQWGIDARFNKTSLIARIQRIAQYRTRIRLSNLDALELLRQLDVGDKPTRALVYLDPPYYVKGRGLYANYYEHADHVAVSEAVQALRLPWVVSYDNVPAIRALYDVPRIEYGLRYTARERYDGKEVMFFSPGLVVPETEDPSFYGRTRRRRRSA